MIIIPIISVEYVIGNDWNPPGWWVRFMVSDVLYSKFCID